MYLAVIFCGLCVGLTSAQGIEIRKLFFFRILIFLIFLVGFAGGFAGAGAGAGYNPGFVQ